MYSVSKSSSTHKQLRPKTTQRSLNSARSEKIISYNQGGKYNYNLGLKSSKNSDLYSCKERSSPYLPQIKDRKLSPNPNYYAYQGNSNYKMSLSKMNQFKYKEDDLKNNSKEIEELKDDLNDEELSIIKCLWDDLAVSKDYQEQLKLYIKDLDEEEKKNVLKFEKEGLKKFRETLLKFTREYNNREKNIVSLKDYESIIQKNVTENKQNLNKKIWQEIAKIIKRIRLFSINTINTITKIRDLSSYYTANGKWNIEKINKNYLFDEKFTLKINNDINFLNTSFIFKYIEKKNDSKMDTFLTNLISINTGEEIIDISASEELLEAIKRCRYYILQDVLLEKIKNKNYILNNKNKFKASQRLLELFKNRQRLKKKIQMYKGSEVPNSNFNASQTLHCLKKEMGKNYNTIFLNAHKSSNYLTRGFHIKNDRYSGYGFQRKNNINKDSSDSHNKIVIEHEENSDIPLLYRNCSGDFKKESKTEKELINNDNTNSNNNENHQQTEENKTDMNNYKSKKKEINSNKNTENEYNDFEQELKNSEKKMTEEQKKEKKEASQDNQKYIIEYYKEDLSVLVSSLKNSMKLENISDNLKLTLNLKEELYDMNNYLKGINPKIIITKEKESEKHSEVSSNVTGICSFYYDQSDDTVNCTKIKINTICAVNDWKEQFLLMINYIKDNLEFDQIVLSLVYTEDEENQIIIDKEVNDLFNDKLNFNILNYESSLNYKGIQQMCFNNPKSKINNKNESTEVNKINNENKIFSFSSLFIISSYNKTLIEENNLNETNIQNTFNYNKYINIIPIYLLLNDLKGNNEIIQNLMDIANYKLNCENISSINEFLNQNSKNINSNILKYLNDDKSIYNDIKNKYQDKNIIILFDVFNLNINQNFNSNLSLEIDGYYYNRISFKEMKIMKDNNGDSKLYLIPTINSSSFIFILEINEKNQKILIDNNKSLYINFKKILTDMTNNIVLENINIYVPSFTIETQLDANDYKQITQKVTNEYKVTSINEYIYLNFKKDSKIKDTFSFNAENDENIIIIKNSFILGIISTEFNSSAQIPLLQLIYVTKDNWNSTEQSLEDEFS